MSACTGAPISWLRLEQYQQGAFDDGERSRIAEHLTACSVCRSCLGKITDDDRALPPLRVPRRARVLWVGSGLALAAVLFLVMGRLPRGDGMGTRMKGGGVAFTLVRHDESVVTDAAGFYRDGDRWKVLVTCPPGMRSAFDLAVYEHGDAVFPLEPVADLPCGNDVALPGAFRLTGREHLTVCLLSGDGIDRETVRRTRPELLPHASCKVLEPAQ